MKINVFCGVALLAMMMALQGEVPVVEAATCNAVELSPCLAAITMGAPPSQACCDKLKEQEPCLCGYIKDPNLGRFVNSPNAIKVQKSCGIPAPKC
ncbi:hypothetical protein RHSIM_Rhsim08G0083800 [Rhododendron simsii]|uniref:Bifunctional inhibitor/plant lipid transfer protein/seed storage helical domain-containing protein n=1 Tax=Rhododendron simsii TaxID=118357 RepID=A0A834GJ19_RHOSS|nr:hypothetical protein RHSIM_Rhsim08G0083800 [Rhododendron simsii]